METKVFSTNVGSCAANLGAKPENYDTIYKTCTAENTQTETYSPNDGGKQPRNLKTDLKMIGIGTGNKLILVQSQANADGTR